MRLYIVGSMSRTQPIDQEQRDYFATSCGTLGKLLASKGVEFVIGSATEHSADYCVLTGAKEYADETSPSSPIKVTVIGNTTDKQHRLQNGRSYEEWLGEKFNVQRIPIETSSNQARLISGLNHSDVAILIGGGNGTMTMGIASLSMKHPALALPQFHGAAEQVWQNLVQYYARGPLSQSEIDKISAPWHPASADAIYLALNKIRRRNPFIERVEALQITLCIALPLLIGLWVSIFSNPERLGLTPSFFLLIAFATAIGSVTKSVATCYFEKEARFSLSLFLAEFVLGFVVVFVLFLLILVGGIIVEGNTVNMDFKDDGQVRRVASSMSLVGLACAFLIEVSLQKLKVRFASIVEDATARG